MRQKPERDVYPDTAVLSKCERGRWGRDRQPPRQALALASAATSISGFHQGGYKNILYTCVHGRPLTSHQKLAVYSVSYSICHLNLDWLSYLNGWHNRVIILGEEKNPVHLPILVVTHKVRKIRTRTSLLLTFQFLSKYNKCTDHPQPPRQGATGIKLLPVTLLWDLRHSWATELLT